MNTTITAIDGLRTINMHQKTLPQGTRLAVIHDPAARNASVVLSVPAGMRHEAPSEEGMMHLLEHMIYQDSTSITSSKREVAMHQGGGILGGHTHMDYSEFYETGPVGQLGPMLSRVVEQVFNPAFKEEQLMEQIDAVAAERANRLASAPGGIRPWPHLSGLCWLDYANSHDGSGDTDLLGRATPERLKKIHQRQYQPGRSVFVALTPENPHQVMQQLSDSFEALEIKAVSARQVGTATPRGSVSEVLTVPGLPAVRRLWATPAAPAEEIHPGLIGDLLTAEMLSLQSGLDASAGMFGPGDLVRDDIFILVDDTGQGLDLSVRLRALLAAGDVTLLRAAQQALFRAEQLTCDNERLVRSTARDLLLRGTVHFGTALVEHLTELSQNVHDIRSLLHDAVTRLASQEMALLSIEPVETEK